MWWSVGKALPTKRRHSQANHGSVKTTKTGVQPLVCAIVPLGTIHNCCVQGGYSSRVCVSIARFLLQPGKSFPNYCVITGSVILIHICLNLLELLVFHAVFLLNPKKAQTQMTWICLSKPPKNGQNGYFWTFLYPLSKFLTLCTNISFGPARHRWLKNFITGSRGGVGVRNPAGSSWLGKKCWLA